MNEDLHDSLQARTLSPSEIASTRSLLGTVSNRIVFECYSLPLPFCFFQPSGFLPVFFLFFFFPIAALHQAGKLEQLGCLCSGKRLFIQYS